MKTILYIEDDFANRILISRILERDYRLLMAETGEAGLALAVEESPDLILIDIGLPDVDGQTVGAILRQFPDLRDTPIVAITAWPPDIAEEMVKRYNFDGCITKPIDVVKFPSLIKEFLETGPHNSTTII